MGSRQRIEAYKAKLALQNSAPSRDERLHDAYKAKVVLQDSPRSTSPPAHSASLQAARQNDAHQARLKADRVPTAADAPPDAMHHREQSAPQGAARPRDRSPLQRNSSAPLRDASPVRGAGDASHVRRKTGGAGKSEVSITHSSGVLLFRASVYGFSAGAPTEKFAAHLGFWV